MRIRGIVRAAGLCYVAAMTAQEQQAPVNVGTVIRTETRQVLVDVIVKDKKDNYVRDLEQKDFKVWEDNKEQAIKSFSYEADPASPGNGQKHYLVLFFDNSTMDYGDQSRARQAAGKFIDGNAGPSRLMAVVNFTGALQVAQNFTADAERLKQVVSGTKMAAVNPNAGASGPSLVAEFGQRSLLLAVRTLAKNMSTVPGRKVLVLFSAGFPLTIGNRPELQAAIDTCNRANVAVYPIDVRGLITTPLSNPDLGIPGRRGIRGFNWQPGLGGPGMVRAAAFVPQQRPGGGGGAPPTGGGGGRAGTGTSGGGSSPGNPGGGNRGTPSPGTGPSRAPTSPTNGNPNAGNRGGANPNANPNIMRNPNLDRMREIVPEFPPMASTNQQVLYMLAQGTGGFVIVNNNDLLSGLEKIGREQNEYYLIGYTPPDSSEGTCHTLRVKVGRGGTTVRARSGYCNVKQVDLLAGKPVERDLETRAAADVPGTIQATMQAPFFYTTAHAARVNVAMEIPSGSIQFEKVKGKQHADLNILGIAYRPDGAVGGRFSDTVKLDFADKKELAAFTEKPYYHYDNQFDLAEGTYNLKVVFNSGGEAFGKVVAAMTVDAYDGKQLFISGIALSKEVHKVSDQDVDLDTALLEGRAPLVVQGFQITPAGRNKFKKTDAAVCYLEVYEPALAEAAAAAAPVTPPTNGEKPVDGNTAATPASGEAAKAAEPAVRVGLQFRVLDGKTGEQKSDTGMQEITQMGKAGSPVIPIGLKIPVATLAAGVYKAEFKVSDTTGRMVTRSVGFEVE